MGIQIGAKPDSDFGDPIGLMSDCHRRVERFLDQLLRLAEDVHGRTLTSVEQKGLETALRYFRTGAPMHTEDEEKSLFPRLRELNRPDADAVLTEMERLEMQHRTAEAAHAEVDDIGLQWLREGRLSDGRGDTMARLLRLLREAYRTHIAYEDENLFPLAKRLLDPAQVEQIGREMAGRRGLDYDKLPEINRCVHRRMERQAAPIA